MITTAPAFQHQSTFDTIEAMDAAADAAGFNKVADKHASVGFHYERPPGPCPEHGGANVCWTQKKHVSRVGMLRVQYQLYTGY